MTKIRKINYTDIFGSDFQTQTIDKKLKDLHNKDKVKVIDNVMDFIF